MTQALKDILAQIDLLEETEEEVVQAALRLRAWRRFQRLAEVERARMLPPGITEAEVDRLVDEAVHEIRYGTKKP
jgi:hypothetical protein